MMKKFAAVLLSTAVGLSLAACGSQGNEESVLDTLPSGAVGVGNESQEPSGQQENTDVSAAGNTADSPAAATEPGGGDSSTEAPAGDSDTESPSGEGKVLVVYYSATGYTENVANYIAAATGGDIFELVPVDEYSSDDLDWTDRDSRVSHEHDNSDERNVELVKSTVENWDSYETIFIGFPIWWGIAAWPVDGFIAANDFTGKTVVPFCTSSSSGLGESGDLLAEAAGTGEWLEGMRFRSSVSEDTVKEWVESLNLY